jgi:hypothetical protein
MADNAHIVLGSIEADVDRTKVVLKHSLRSGNDTEVLNLSNEEFNALFATVQAIGLLKPEWIN